MILAANLLLKHEEETLEKTPPCLSLFSPILPTPSLSLSLYLSPVWFIVNSKGCGSVMSSSGCVAFNEIKTTTALHNPSRDFNKTFLVSTCPQSNEKSLLISNATITITIAKQSILMCRVELLILHYSNIPISTTSRQ